MSKGRQAGIWDAIRKAGGLKAMGLRTPHLVTLLNMADHECDQTGECYMCSKTVAEETGQNASRVRTQWGELRTKGVIFEKSRVPTKDGWKIYWGWNEGVFSKSQITQGNEEGGTSLLSVIPNHSGQHEPLNRNEVNERRDFQSTALQSEKGDQIGKDHPSSEQVVGILPTQRNPTQPEQPLEKPTFPFLIALLEHLKDPYKITHPGRKDSWPDIEARLRKKHNPDQLKELEEAVQWIFSPDTDPFWRRAIVDPQKKDKDPIGFVVNNTDGILKDFQLNRGRTILVGLGVTTGKRRASASTGPQLKPGSRPPLKQLKVKENPNECHNRWAKRMVP